MQDGSVSPIKSFFRNKWVIAVLVIDILIIIFIIVLITNKATETAIINFNITPIDATISVNGSTDYRNGGQAYSLTPGVYDVQISHPNLDTKNFTVNLEKNHNTTITTFLSQNNSFDFYKLRDNISSFYKLAEIASSGNNQTTDQDTSAENFIADFQKNYNLYSTELPLTYSEYEQDEFGRKFLSKYVSVRMGYDCDITLCLNISLNKGDEPIAEKLLRDAGFNVEDFEIEYKFY